MSSTVFGQSLADSSSLLPRFQEESAFKYCCPNLTIKQRIIGFTICVAIGWCISLIGTLVLLGGFSDQNIDMFVILYVIGNIISLISTGFLLGPASQCTKMWHQTRRFSTAFYLLTLAAVLVVAITAQNIFLVFFTLFVEILASFWYNISYIPYARDMCLRCMRSTGVCMPCFFVSDAVHAQIKKMKWSSGDGSNSTSSLPSIAEITGTGSDSKKESGSTVGASVLSIFGRNNEKDKGDIESGEGYGKAALSALGVRSKDKVGEGELKGTESKGATASMFSIVTGRSGLADTEGGGGGSSSLFAGFGASGGNSKRNIDSSILSSLGMTRTKK